MNPFIIILHLLFTFTTNFIICSIIQINLEEPINKFSKVISEYIWIIKKYLVHGGINTMYYLEKF